jgi:hypothetical protein
MTSSSKRIGGANSTKPLSRLLPVLAESTRPIEAEPAQHTQAKSGPVWHSARARSRREPRAPTRNILLPISDNERRTPCLGPSLAPPPSNKIRCFWTPTSIPIKKPIWQRTIAVSSRPGQSRTLMRPLLSATKTDRGLRLSIYEDEPGRRTASKMLSKDEARRIAANIAKLPELVRRRERGPA